MVEGRIARLRELMGQRGWDACVLRNNPDLRWLTGAERVFDDEVAHTAFVTAEGLWLHTDSRYCNTFHERLGESTSWKIDEEIIDANDWAADRAVEAGACVVAVEDTCDLAFFDAFSASLVARGVKAELPRMHGDICELRAVKDEEEIELLRQAQVVTDAAFKHICGFIEPGLTEMQIRVELENYMLTHGGDGISFGTIIASGPNGANPHAQPGQRKVERGDLIVMDYGSMYHDYHADMTRTVAVGEAGPEQRRVYDIVRRAHETAAAAIRPGVIGKDIHQIAVDVITEAGYGDYFKHGLGHGVGIQIHERPGFNRRWDKPIPAGSVITVEPGIYLPGRFGIRLEDCGLVTEHGYEPFTQSPHELTLV